MPVLFYQKICYHKFMITLDSKIEIINGVAKRIAPKLKNLGVETAGQLLTYWPFRWEDWSQVKKIKDVEPNTTVTIKGQIELIQNKRSQWKKRLITEAIVSDESERIKAIWFHQPYLVKNLKQGDHLFLSGKVELGKEGLQLIHPQYERITRYKRGTMHTARIVPIYPLTKNLTAKQLRYVMSSIIGLASYIKDWLPISLVAKNKLEKLPWAIKQIHFPDNKNNLNRALERIKFDELFLIQLRASLAKQLLKKSRAHKIEFREKETKKFVDSLPYKLTGAQKISGWEILKDLGKNIPMNRLLEGDVGSGKTVVAGLAILNSVLNKYQVAYMAPTEILATQHFETLDKLFKGWKIRIGLLTSSEKKINKNREERIKNQEIYKMISKHKIDLVIGTHALIQNKVEFKDLALVIIDEQHRFGVAQRKRLKSKSVGQTIPHLLSMTATPIPRSLALTVYGDLDLSIIDEMPLGRKKVITEVVPPEKRPTKYKFVLDRIKQGEQVFVICPLIDPSDKLGVRAVKDEYEKLNKKIFPKIPMGLMHGKLKARDKEKVMLDFLKKKTKILVSTPVIEVGIDVANATLMLIESAERFGLAQLHQFRGRVGRSHKQSYCFMFTESDSQETMRRLDALVKSNNGFKLAEADLEFRGPGETYGIRQSGYKDELKVAKLTDYIIIKKSRAAVDEIVKQDAELKNFPTIKERLDKFEQEIHLE
jgi:ATP-dependent DNA helicase RecG